MKYSKIITHFPWVRNVFVLVLAMLSISTNAQNRLAKDIYDKIISAYDTSYARAEVMDDKTFLTLLHLSDGVDDSLALILELHQAKLNYELGRHEEAEVLLTTVLNRLSLDEHVEIWARSKQLLAMIHHSQQLHEEAIGELQEILSRQEELREYMLGSVYTNLGLVYSDINSSEKAYDAYLKALKFQGDERNHSTAVLYNNIASLCIGLSWTDKLLEYVQEAESIALELSDDDLLIDIYVNYGIAMKIFGEYEKSIEYFDKVTELYHDRRDIDLAIIYINLGNVYLQLEDYPQAEAAYLESLSISDSLSVEQGSYFSLINLGKLGLQEGDYMKALRYYDRAKEKSMFRANDGYTLLLRQGYVIALDSLGYYNRAFQELKEVTRLSDSLQLDESKARIVELQEQYNQEKNQTEIVRLEKEVLNKQVRESNMWLALIVLLNVIILLIGFWWYKRMRYNSELKRVKMDLKFKEDRIIESSLEKIRLNECVERMNKLVAGLDFSLTKSDEKLAIRALKKEIKKVNPSTDLNDFLEEFTQIHRGFLHALNAISSELDRMELIVCCLIKMNMTNKEIGAFLNKGVRTVEGIRTSLREKLNLDQNTRLKGFLNHLD